MPLAALFTVTLVSCEEGILTDDLTEKGTLQVIMHDQPVNYDEVWVEVDHVKVHRNENAEDGETGWTVVAEPQERFDLLQLINGAEVVLGEEELEAGTYRQMRLVLGEENSVVVDGEEHDLEVPGGSQTGVKLNINTEIEPDFTHTIVLDFDASRSVVQRGQAQQGGSFLLKPVIRASTPELTGNIAGSVTPAEAEPFVYAIAEEDTLAGSRADEESGEFLLRGLDAGTYDVAFEPNEDYEEVTIEDVDVAIGETTQMDEVELTESNDD